MKKIAKGLAAVLLVITVGSVGAPQTAEAASKGYVFKYKGVSVTMKKNAAGIIKKAGKPIKIGRASCRERV